MTRGAPLLIKIMDLLCPCHSSASMGSTDENFRGGQIDGGGGYGDILQLCSRVQN